MITDIIKLHTEVAKILRLKIPSNIPIGMAEQGNPSYPNWISYKLTKWQSLGQAISDYDDDNPNNSDYTTHSIWRVTLQVVGIGNLSEQYIVNLAHQLQKLTYLDNFTEVGLVYLNHDPIRPSPRAVGTGWEQRHILDINFNITLSDTDQLDFIDTVEITHEIQNELGDVIMTRTDEIDI